MSETVTPESLGTTELLVRSVRGAVLTEMEVTSEATTEIVCQMTARRVDIDITGGAPGPPGGRGERGSDGVGSANYDPGDFTLYFDNSLI